MKGSKPFPLVGLGLILCTLLSACGGKTPQNGPSPLNITTLTLPAGAVGDVYKEGLVATGGQQPFTWTIDSGALPAGLSLSTDGVISGTPTTAGTSAFTLRVTDSQSPVKAYQVGSTSITINPPLSFPATTLSNGVIATPYSSAVAASGGIMPYTYVLAQSSLALPAGLTLNSDGTITGTPTGPVGPYTFTVQVTDSFPRTATANLSITVTGKLQGNYAFSFNGYNNGQPFYMAGSFIADGNGNITSGVLDRNGSDSIGQLKNMPFTGIYQIDNTTSLGTMTLTIPGLATTFNYNLAVSVVADSRFIQIDPNMYGSGVIKKQTGITGISLASLAGGFTFGFFGVDPGKNRYAGAGTFTSDSIGNLTGLEDTNDNSIVQSQVPFTGNFLTVDPATGRGTMALTVGSSTIDYAFYVVTLGGVSNELAAVQIDPVSSGASLTLASILKQGAAGSTGGTNFTKASLKGVAVTELNAVSKTSGAPDISVGLANFDGAGNITSYTFDENNGGTLTTPSQNSYTGTYTVDPKTGRVTVTGLGSYQPVWYLVSANPSSNLAFVVGTDPNVTAGSLEPQAGSSFTDVSLLGKFYGGTSTPVLSTVTNEVDAAVATPPPPPGSGNGTLTVTYKSNGPNGVPGSQMLAATYSVDSTGRTVTTDANGNPIDILYIVSAGTSGATGTGAKSVSLNTGKNPRLTVLVH